MTTLKRTPLVVLDDTDGGIAVLEYLQHGGDPDAHPDQITLRRVLPWFLLHNEPGHQCDVCSSGDPIPVGPHLNYCRKARALTHLLNSGVPATFSDQEAILAVLPIYERSRRLPLFAKEHV